MPRHPSLHRPFDAPQPLKPYRQMKPWKPCWCRSGKTYEECHLDRDKQKPVNMFELEAAMLANLRDGYCAHPNRQQCSLKIIKSHTVQRNGGLAAIADDGHVLSVMPSMKMLRETNGKPQPSLIGLGKASVFPGFCGFHDDGVFKPIEGKSLTLDVNAAFLFAYRALAYESFQKEKALRANDLQRESDKGRPFEEQATIQQHLHIHRVGLLLGQRDARRWKKEFDQRLISGSRDGFHFVAVRFDRVLPIVACGGLHPQFDFAGKPLQMLGRGGADFEHLTLTITAFEGQTIAVFGWIGAPNGPAADLARSFLEVPVPRKADALVRLCMAYMENTFLKPSWWTSLSEDCRRRLSRLLMSGTPVQPHSGKDLMDDELNLVTATVTETSGNGFGVVTNPNPVKSG
jgi:hypothetical protein